MLGTYRLILALLVALSHIGITIIGLNPGVIAVVGFYLVSGYVMTGLIRTHYDTLDKIRGFYLDRLLRLFPHYLSVCCLTLAWFFLTGARTDYLKIQPAIIDIVSNLLVVPQNYFMFNDASDFSLIPPSWSLGAEIQFYLLIPFILLFNLRQPAKMLSALVYICATMGLIHTDWFGYRLLPGVLFMFLLGSLLFDLRRPSAHPRHARQLVCGVAAAAAVLGAALAYGHKINLPYNRETLLGLIIGLLALHWLARHPRHDLDEAFGNLSYGVFLNHFLVKWVFFDGQVAGVRNVIVYLAISLVIAFFLYQGIEKPVHRFRKQLRALKPACRLARGAPEALS
jgi:peptidoglycan/LPS O-acetylase OafA/YrhL